MCIQFIGINVDPQLQRRIGDLLAGLKDARLRKIFRRMEIEVHPPLSDDTAVEQAHRIWNSPAAVSGPEGGPQLPEGAICPRGSLLVEVAYIQRLSGGMSSYYQFDGWFLSLIVAQDYSAILDARLEQAS